MTHICTKRTENPLKRNRIRVVFILHFIVFLSVSAAHAYIDAGSGSLVLQLILGGAVGAGLFLKMVWKRIFSKKPPSEKTK